MSVRVTFYLGPASSLSNRQLTITRHAGAGDDDPITATVDDGLGGNTEIATAVLNENTIYVARLVDTASSGEVSVADQLFFSTGELQFPGPKSQDRLSILSMEELSSSSGSSSSPSSISTSSASSSSISTSSTSTSSQSSRSDSQSSASSASSTSSLSSVSSISTSSDSSSSSSSSRESSQSNI